jgi:lipoate-protein ligase A
MQTDGVAENLALDEALLIEADAGRGRSVVRLWEPREYVVVLGASCPLAGDVFPEACRADGVPILRRSSGGGTVVVGPGVLCVTVILPEQHAQGLTRVDLAQGYVLEAIAAAVRGAGASVSVLGRGDLVIGDRKCAGSAQRRLKSWFMVHCSILFDFAIERVERYLRMPRREPAYRAGRSHGDFLINLALPRQILADTIRGAFSPGTGVATESFAPPPLVESLLAERFSNRQWIERF